MIMREKFQDESESFRTQLRQAVLGALTNNERNDNGELVPKCGARGSLLSQLGLQNAAINCNKRHIGAIQRDRR